MSKEQALKALEKRKAHPPKRVDNASLYAGSPMYYYCRSCGALADVLGEEHISPPRHLCDDCEEMKDKGWL
jgi:hypothetical protein